MARQSAGRRVRDRLKDVELDLAPWILIGPDGAGREVPQTMTARGLLMEATDEFKQHELRRWPGARLNEQYIGGEQYGGLKTKNGQQGGASELIVDWPEWLPRTTRNLMRNLHLTSNARVTKGDPAVKAWGGDPGVSDRNGADIANKLVYSLRTNQDHRKKISRGAWTCGAQGTCAFYTTWNGADGPRNDDGTTQGDISFEPLSTFDWFTDGSEEIEKSDYCGVRRWMKVDEACKRLYAVGIDTPPEEKTIVGVWGNTETRRVEAIEYWYKPTPGGRFPGGLMVIFVGGHVVEAHGPHIVDRGQIPGGDKYPYDHGQLPLSIWKWVDLPDSPYGGTPADDAVPLQAHLNRLHASLAFITAKTARWLKVETVLRNVAKWNGKDQILDKKQGEPETKIIGCPPPPALLYTQIEEAERMLREVYGVNESSVGSDTGDASSAVMLKHITELDAQKLLTTIIARDHALLRSYQQMLRLWQQFVAIARTRRIIGDDGIPAIQAFVGSDLAGVDLYLEPAPGAQLTHTAQAAAAEQEVVSGFTDLATGKELKQTGQSATSFSVFARKLVQKQIENVSRGFGEQADPSIPADVAVGAIQLALAGAPPQAEAALMELLQAYQKAAAPPAAPAQAPKSNPSAVLQKKELP